MRYMATIQYDGTDYCGWQRQENGLSVQEVLERSFEKLLGTPHSIQASGRTDAGVHAAGQVVHFDSDTSIPAEKLPYAINTILPDDVKMLDCRVATEDFNARFDAKRKTYRYSMYVSPHLLPLKERYAERVAVMPDVRLMKQAAQRIVGEHDFACFEATGSVVKNTIRTVYSLEVEEQGGDLTVTITGNGFLYNMVRIIAGTLLYVGTGKLTVEDVERVLLTGDRTQAGKTLPAKGLCLLSVEYENA